MNKKIEYWVAVALMVIAIMCECLFFQKTPECILAVVFTAITSVWLIIEGIKLYRK